MLQTVHADIAQLVEQRTCNAQVIGSIPIVGFNCILIYLCTSEVFVYQFVDAFRGELDEEKIYYF